MLNGHRRNGHRRLSDKTCAICKQPYYRRNMIEGWTAQNPGHRTGWIKTTLRVCTGCQPASQTAQAFMVVEAKVVRPEVRRLRRRKKQRAA